MSPSPSNLTSEDREQLVAYLDGELPSSECAGVEDRLSADSSYREEMQRLARAWDALDHLPRETAGDEFAKTTIELVTVAAEKETERHASGAATRRRWLKWSLAFAAAIGVGFVTVRAVWPDPNDLLIDDLPVVQHLDALSQMGDVAFLRSLENTFKEAPQRLSAEELNAARTATIELASAPRADRLAFLSTREAPAARSIAIHFENYQQLDHVERARLRQLHHEIASADDSAALLATLASYAAWLDERTAGERAALRELPDAERLEEIDRIVARDRARAMRHLPPEELDVLRKTVVEFAGERRAAWTSEIPESRRKFFDDLSPQEFTRRWLMFNAFRSGRRRGEDPGLAEFYDRAATALSPESQGLLNRMQGPRQRMELMGRWLSQAFRPPEISDKVLETFFTSDALSNDERERLLATPRDEMREELRRQYYRQEFGVSGDERREPPPFGEDRRGDGRRPPDRGGPDRGGPERGGPGGRGGGPRDGRGRFDGPRHERGDRPGRPPEPGIEPGIDP